MPRGNKNNSHSSSQEKAAELQNLATHNERVGEHAGDSSHLTPHEQSRQSEEHHHATESTVGHGIQTFGHLEIAALAYQLWEARGRPEGSPEEDWSQAVKELRGRNLKTHSAANG
jgi:hypothetical protein